MRKKALYKTRDAAVTEMARALSDHNPGAGRHCLYRTLAIEQARGSLGALVDLRAPSGAGPQSDDPLRPGAIVFMPEGGDAELVTRRGKLLWLAEDLTEEQQDTVNAYARAAAPELAQVLCPSDQGNQTWGKEGLILSLAQAAEGGRRRAGCWCQGGPEPGDPAASGCSVTRHAMQAAGGARLEQAERE
jgi:hypothetical protein